MKLSISLLLLQMLSQKVIATKKKDLNEETASYQQYPDQEVGLEMVAIVNSFHQSWTGDCHSICKTKREELLHFLKRQRFVGYNMLSQFWKPANHAPSFWIDECLRMSKFCASLNDAWETDEFFQHSEEASMDGTNAWSARRPLCDWKPIERFFTPKEQPIATCRVTEPKVKSCLCRVMLILQRARKSVPFKRTSKKLALAIAEALETPNIAIELTKQPEDPLSFCEPRAICQRLTNKVHKYATDDSTHNWFCNAGFFINHVKTAGRDERRVINKCACSTLRRSPGSAIEHCVAEEYIRDAMGRAGVTPLRSSAFETIEVEEQPTAGPSTTIAEAFRFGQIRSLDEQFRNQGYDPSQVDGPANERNPSMAVPRSDAGHFRANPFTDTRDRGKRKVDQLTPDESDVGTLAPALDLTLSLSQPISMTELIQDGALVRVGAVQNMQPPWKKTAIGESSSGAAVHPHADDAGTSEEDQEEPLPFVWL